MSFCIRTVFSQAFAIGEENFVLPHGILSATSAATRLRGFRSSETSKNLEETWHSRREGSHSENAVVAVAATFPADTTYSRREGLPALLGAADSTSNPDELF